MRILVCIYRAETHRYSIEGRKISDYPDVASMKSLTLDTLPTTIVEQIVLLTENLEHTAHHTAVRVRLRKVCIMLHYHADHLHQPQIRDLVKDARAWNYLADLLAEEQFRSLKMRLHIVSPGAEEIKRDLVAWLEGEMGIDWVTIETTNTPWSNL